MGRRKDHNREELYELIMVAAWNIAEANGFRALTARRIALEVGYAPGTLYNVFEDLDDLVLHLRVRMLEALRTEMLANRSDSEPETRLLELANCYVDFTRRHPKLWAVMFEHNLPDTKQIPPWYHEKSIEMLALVEECLAPLLPSDRKGEKQLLAHVLWSALHGICQLQTSGKSVINASTDVMTECLVKTFLSGLRIP